MESLRRIRGSNKTSAVLFLGGLVLALSSLRVGLDLPGNQKTPTHILVCIGIFLVLVAVLTARNERAGIWLDGLLGHAADWFRSSPWQFALIITGLLLSMLAHYAAGFGLLMYSPFVAWAAWALSITLVLAGGWQRGGLDLKVHRKALLIALGLAALGLLMRGTAMELIPIILYGDEASGGIEGTYILDGTFNNPFTMGWNSYPGLFFFIPAGMIRLFGQTTAALRLPSALAGSLTVGALYLTGRVMYGKRVGLLAALMLAGFHLHIHFSRIGLSNIWDGLFYVAVVGTVWYGWERENRNAFILAGFGLGLSQYFYTTSHGLLVLVPGWLVIASFFDRQRIKRLLPDLALMALTALVIVIPLAWFYVSHPGEFIVPMTRVGVFGGSLDPEMQAGGLPVWKLISKRLWLGALSFTHLNIKGWWYQPDAPLLRPYLAAFFFLGLALLFLRLREARTILPVLWLALFGVMGGLSEYTPASQRYIAAAPVCVMIAAIGLNGIAALLERFRPKVVRFTSAAVLAMGLYLSAEDALFYFFHYTPISGYYLARTNGMVAQRLGEYLQAQPEETQVIFFGWPRMGYYSIPSLQYLAPDIVGLDMEQPWGAPENPVPDSNRLIFVFLPEHIGEIPLVQADYPGGELLEQKAFGGGILYYCYLYEEDGQPRPLVP